MGRAVDLDVVDRNSDVELPTLESLRCVIAPAEFPHELVPHRDFGVGRPAAMRESPFEHFVVTRAGVHSFHHFAVIEVEERAALRVEPFPQIRLVIRWQCAARVHANFVEHPPEINNAAKFLRRTADREFFHRTLNF